jgi:parvulin-like peptidyl-prolyl isomerase
LNAKKVDGIVAIVNQEPILKSQLRPGTDLESLIDDELVKQEAKKLGLFPSESDLEQSIQGIMKQNRLSSGQFVEALAKQGTPMPIYRQQLRNQMIKARLIQSKVKPKIAQSSLSQTKLEAEQASFDSSEEAEEALKNPKTIQFESMGKVSAGDLLPEVSKPLFSLKEGQISKPIKSSRGYLLFRVIKRIEIPLDAPGKGRYETEVENAYKRYVKELRANAYIERK